MPVKKRKETPELMDKAPSDIKDKLIKIIKTLLHTDEDLEQLLFLTRQAKEEIGAILFFYCLFFQHLTDLQGNIGHIERFLNKPVTSFVHNLLRLTAQTIATAEDYLC